MLIARFLLLLMFSTLLPEKAQAQDFSGDYDCLSEPGIVLQLRQNNRGQISGVLNEEDESFSLVGTLTPNGFTGHLHDEGERVVISAIWRNNQLELSIEDAGTLNFVRRVMAAPNQHGTALTNTLPDVIINGIKLTRQQIDAIRQQYGVNPKTGHYWYDSHSGLFGYHGQAAVGFMLPGHSLGQLDANASAGTTGVFINGRQLPQNEWMIWSVTLGYAIQPGRYWLDGQGNAGYEGSPFAVVNLYQAAQRRNASAPAANNGDHFWSSRFSAGNYDPNSGAGYVSVPGYGPIGFGGN